MHSNEDLELFFSKITPSFWKRFLSTFSDLSLVCLLLLPIGYGVMSPNGQNIPAWKCFIFLIILLIVFYIYFIFIPSKRNNQTIFSQILGIRSVNLDKNFKLEDKLSKKQLFLLNLIPVFMGPIVFLLFFAIASMADNENWVDLFQNSKNQSLGELVGLTRIIFSVVSLIQMYYLFTVSMSKKINWLRKYINSIDIDMKKYTFTLKKIEKPNILIKKDDFSNDPFLIKPDESITKE